MGRKLVRALVYVAVVAIFFEGASRVVLRIHPVYKAMCGSLQEDVSWRLRWVRNHEDLEIYHRTIAHDPTKGWVPLPNLRDLEEWSGSIVNTNSRGLRGRTDFSYESETGKPRILLIGDSFTWGDEVGDEVAYPHLLQKRLPGVEVLNLAVSGYGHDQMLIYLEEEGVRYRPDIVMLGFVHQVMKRNLLGFRDFAKPRYELESGELRVINVPVVTPQDTLRTEIYRSKFLDLLSIFRDRLWSASGKKQAAVERMTEAILDRMIEVSRSAGATPVFVHLPVNKEIEEYDPEPNPGEAYLRGYCTSRQIDCVYLRPLFMEELRQGETFKTLGHWAEKGHQVVADGIAEYLAGREDLLPRAAR
jgi:hypothetical protein